MQQHRQPDANCGAIHGGNHRLFASRDRFEKPGDRWQILCVIRRGKILQVIACGEIILRSGNDKGALCVRGLIGVERIRHDPIHLLGDRIAFLRPIDGQKGNPAIGL